MAGGAALSPRRLHPLKLEAIAMDTKTSIARIEKEEATNARKFSASGRSYYDWPDVTLSSNSDPISLDADSEETFMECHSTEIEDVDVPDCTDDVPGGTQEKDQRMFAVAEALFERLDGHHGKRGGITKDDAAVHFGGQSELFGLMDFTDGEVTLKEWMSFMHKMYEQKGATTLRFLLRNLERSIEAHYAKALNKPTPAPPDGPLVETAVPSLSQHGFTATWADGLLHFHVLTLRDSLFVWGGANPPEMSHLSIAIKTKWDDMPTSTTVLGSDSEWIEPFASKLAKRLGKVLFLSCNFQDASFEKQMAVQKALATELPKLFS